MNNLKLTKEKLDTGQIIESAYATDCGAVSAFIGTIRDNFENKKVVQLEYEAYEPMALKILEKICNEIRAQWPDVKNIVIYHRLGVVPVMEASTVVVISSPHRKESLQATEWCINAIKKQVPIWKKEIYADSEPEWKENRECTWSSNFVETDTFYPPRRKKFKVDLESQTEVTYVSPHSIQIKATNEEVNKRIENFIEKKRSEINVNNVKEFCMADSNSTCARIDTILLKRKDSKGHLQVSEVYNNYSRDQSNSDYLTKYMPSNSIEERVENLEIQLNLTTPIPQNIYARLKKLEDKMLYLESISPEYVNLWDKINVPNKVKKKVFSIQEIDSLMCDLERKLLKNKTT